MIGIYKCSDAHAVKSGAAATSCCQVLSILARWLTFCLKGGTGCILNTTCHKSHGLYRCHQDWLTTALAKDWTMTRLTWHNNESPKIPRSPKQVEAACHPPTVANMGPRKGTLTLWHYWLKTWKWRQTIWIRRIMDAIAMCANKGLARGWSQPWKNMFLFLSTSPPQVFGEHLPRRKKLATQGRGRDNRQQTLSLWMRRGVISGMIEGHSPFSQPAQVNDCFLHRDAVSWCFLAAAHASLSKLHAALQVLRRRRQAQRSPWAGCRPWLWWEFAGTASQAAEGRRGPDKKTRELTINNR